MIPEFSAEEMVLLGQLAAAIEALEEKTDLYLLEGVKIMAGSNRMVAVVDNDEVVIQPYEVPDA